MNAFDDSQLNNIADALVDRGYVVLDSLLPEELLQGLINEMDALRADELKPAGIGRHADFQIQNNIRTDKIHWITENSFWQKEFLLWMDSLRIGLNERLFMGLFDYESHFSFYPLGAFYKKHVDAFRANVEHGKANRVLSTVLYLNENWVQSYGGELLIYEEVGDSVLEKILPEKGRLVIFLSEKFPHEVLPGKRLRKSIAGWFRVNEGVR